MNKENDHWTKQELEVYINYCKLNNLKYESFWVNLEDEEREKALLDIHNQLLKIDKPVKIYLDFEYINTIRYSLIDFVKDEFSNNLLTWIPNNFASKEEMAMFLDNHLEKEINCN